MSRKNRKPTQYAAGVALIVIAAFFQAQVALADTSVNATETQTALPRTSDSLHFETGGRSNQRDPARARSSEDVYEPLNTGGTRGRTATKLSAAADGSTAAQSASYDFWFYEADVILFDDLDRDGYYHGIDLLFDVDTNFVAADVYAVLYLSYEGGPWNEYAVTEDFRIYGSSATDEFVMVTELLSGYPAGEYDLLIELFDADYGTFLTSFGPADTSELAYLPLEDAARDAVVVDTVVIVTDGGGGAFGLWTLLALLVAGRYRAYKAA